ncbi:MAG: permease [Candidatus Marinimicrobia bacterium]|nr:permease [Candidatus Neomarinimicrobiota bacterium]
MSWREEGQYLIWIVGGFLLFYFLPVEGGQLAEAVTATLELSKWYAREHVLLCLVPAFFIAGVIAVFVSQGAVIKYFGATAKKWLAYLIASVSGSVLAVCSCTILPLFSSIYKRGAGIGPAVTFLYSGPAVNILAMILTARILGFKLGVARIIGAVLFSIVIGLIMKFIYHREEVEKAADLQVSEMSVIRPLWQTATHFFILVAILIFTTWAAPQKMIGIWASIWSIKWKLVSLAGLALSLSLVYIIGLNRYRVMAGISLVAIASWGFPLLPLVPFLTGLVVLVLLLLTTPGESQEWLNSTWGFTKQILPLLAAGVLVAGLLLGSPEGGRGLIPDDWVAGLVGGNSLWANFFAALVGSFMYFATLTEVPILQGLINSGMGQGPALALLLAGPALSLPNMLVIRSVIGTQKTLVFVALVVVMATFSGVIFGIIN